MADSTVRKSTRVLVISSIMGALTIIMGLTHIGLIPWFTGISLTVMQIPAIIAAILEGPWAGLIVGAIFGLFSMIQAILGPTGALDPLFTNPFLSILPRLFIGPVAWLAYRAFRGRHEVAASATGGVVGSLTNTVLVLGMANAIVPMTGSWIALLNPLRGAFHLASLPEGATASFIPFKTLLIVLAGNGLPEAVLSGIITMLVIVAWKKISPSGKSGISKIEEGR